MTVLMTGGDKPLGGWPCCGDCGCELTAEEIAYYETSCERCEALWSAHMTLWRLNKIDDVELDQTFSTTK